MNTHPDMANLVDRRPKAGGRASAASARSTSPCRAAARTAPSPGACSTACSTRPNLSFEGVVATSAGAMNAAVLAYGLAEGGRRGAQKALANFWRRVSHAAAFSPLQPSLFDRMTGSRSLEHSPAFMVFDMVTRLHVALPVQSVQLSIRCGPYSSSRSTSTPFACRAVPLKVNVCATNVRTRQGQGLLE